MRSVLFAPTILNRVHFLFFRIVFIYQLLPLLKYMIFYLVFQRDFHFKLRCDSSMMSQKPKLFILLAHIEE